MVREATKEVVRLRSIPYFRVSRDHVRGLRTVVVFSTKDEPKEIGHFPAEYVDNIRLTDQQQLLLSPVRCPWM